MEQKGKQKETENNKSSKKNQRMSNQQQQQQQQNLDETPQDSPHVPGLEYEEKEGEDHADEESQYDNGHGEEENEDEDDEEVGDEGDEEEMMNELNRVRRALGLQMEGLFGGMPSDSSRFRSILSSLKNQEEPTMQLIALQELAEILSVSNEDNLIGYFSCDSFVKELIRIMSGPEIMADMDDDMMLALAMSEGLSAGNPEIMLLACRCISNLLDALPTAATSIVFHGGIKVLCQKLKSIQYIDLAEQALCALEKISAQVPRAVVHEGGLGASLMYFDFFSVHAQRTALRTASNCLQSIAKQPIVSESQPAQNDANLDESDATTTDAEKKQEGDEEDESEQEERRDTAIGSSQERSSLPQRRILDRGDLQALLQEHYALLQSSRTGRHSQSAGESEKGLGRGSVRKYIIQLAQNFIANYFHTDEANAHGVLSRAPGSTLKEIAVFTEQLMNPQDKESAEKTLVQLSTYLKNSPMGISSFELTNSGLMKAMLAFLAQKDGFNNISREERKHMFETIFMDTPDLDEDGNNSLKKLVVRLHEILSRSETFEVVSPLESSSSDSLRNPTSMLAKQLRLRLTGKGENIPSSYRQLMVSTHAVAMFRVLEEYLLARLRASSELEDHHDDEHEEDENDDDEEEHMLISGNGDDDEEEGMDVDDEDEEMVDAVEVQKDNSEDEETSEGKQSKPCASSSNNKKKDGEWRIRFSLNGTVISNDTTVYAAVHQYEMKEERSQARAGRSIWSSSYPVTFERDILRIFRAVAKASPHLSFELLKMDIIGTFYHILTGSAAATNQPQTSHVTLDSKWRESVPTIIKTMADLLPPLPKNSMFSSRRFKENGPVASRTRSSGLSLPSESGSSPVDPRISWFEEHSEFLVRIDSILFPLFLDMYASTVNLRVRQLIIHTMLRLTYYTNPEDLEKVLKNVPLSSFLSGILTRQEQPGLIIDALLKLLTHSELVALFGTSEDDWSLATLTDTIKADHGFTMESKSVQYLLEILSEMDAVQRREFLQFTTGSPRLPIGGWKALRPVFTVVRKVPESNLSPDDYLPSVMTCANYLKMPEYSSKEIMRQKLEKSMKEGQNSFLLS
ncbi:Putative Ubiquitin-protein ligase [Rhizopus microsporus]|nr:Putative Ubiquitin-protein ligase [Rhizopus microsporus]